MSSNTNEVENKQESIPAMPTNDEGQFDDLDDVFDKMRSDDPNSAWQTIGNKPLSEIPLFADAETIERDAENGTLPPAIQALQNLIYTDRDPKDLAEDYKYQGNEKMKHGKVFLDNAIKFYTDALEQKYDDDKLRASLYANRAQANLVKGNYGRVIEDCKASLSLDPSNVKVYFRLSTAALALEKFDVAAQYCVKGSQLATGASLKSFSNLKSKIEKAHAAEKKRIDEALARKQKRANVSTRLEELELVVSPKLLEVNQMGGNTQIRIDPETDELTFPVVFLYDEHSQSDFIQSVGLDDIIADHLHEMLVESKPEWDTNNDYDYEKIEIFTIGRKSTEKMLPEEAKKKENSCKRHQHRWIRIGPNTTLRKILTHPSYEMFEIPMFWIVSKTSGFKKTFLEHDPDSRFFP